MLLYISAFIQRKWDRRESNETVPAHFAKLSILCIVSNTTGYVNAIFVSSFVKTFDSLIVQI